MNTVDDTGSESTADREFVHSRLIVAPERVVFEHISEAHHFFMTMIATSSPVTVFLPIDYS